MIGYYYWFIELRMRWIDRWEHTVAIEEWEQKMQWRKESKGSKREKIYDYNKDREWEINKRDWMKEVGVFILKGLWYEDEVNEKKYWSKGYDNR